MSKRRSVRFPAGHCPGNPFAANPPVQGAVASQEADGGRGGPLAGASAEVIKPSGPALEMFVCYE